MNSKVHAISLKGLQALLERESQEGTMYKKVTFENIANALENSFVFSDKIAKIISLSLVSKKNCLLWGEGGHAKSLMTQHAVAAAGLTEDCFIQSFGEGMDESRLWGGINYGKLEAENPDDRAIEFNTDRSFLMKKVAVFEELFDAPPVVLLSLKDTLTARRLRNGAQQVDMQTESIIALTNRNPQEISEMGAAAHALVERFPLQLEVKWDRYDGKSYNMMFRKVYPNTDQDFMGRLAFMIERAINEDAVISPRTAIHALETLLEAKQAGLDERDMYNSLAFIPGFECILDSIDAEIKEAQERQVALSNLQKVQDFIGKEREGIARANDANECIQSRNRLESIRDDLSQLRVPDNLIEQRDQLLQSLKESMEYALTHSYTLAGVGDEKETQETSE